MTNLFFKRACVWEGGLSERLQKKKVGKTLDLIRFQFDPIHFEFSELHFNNQSLGWLQENSENRDMHHLERTSAFYIYSNYLFAHNRQMPKTIKMSYKSILFLVILKGSRYVSGGGPLYCKRGVPRFQQGVLNFMRGSLDFRRGVLNFKRSLNCQIQPYKGQITRSTIIKFVLLRLKPLTHLSIVQYLN